MQRILLAIQPEIDDHDSDVLFKTLKGFSHQETIPSWQDAYPWYEHTITLSPIILSPISKYFHQYNFLRTKPEFPNEVFYQMEPAEKKVPVQVIDDAVDRLFKGSGRHLYILRNIVGQL